jgi:hypothetical protein
MQNILTYPGVDANGAPIVFEDLVNDTSKTKLLVLFNDAIALKARQYVADIVESHPQEYVSVIFLFVDQPLLILSELKKLTVKLKNPVHTLDWDQYASYRVLSISPGNKLISDAVTANELDSGYGLIRAAILFAFANG